MRRYPSRPADRDIGSSGGWMQKVGGGRNERVDRASQLAWMRQWRRAAVALREQRRLELRALTDRDALAATDALLSLGALLPLDARRLADSGLVRQQALFHRARR